MCSSVFFPSNVRSQKIELRVIFFLTIKLAYTSKHLLFPTFQYLPYGGDLTEKDELYPEYIFKSLDLCFLVKHPPQIMPM